MDVEALAATTFARVPGARLAGVLDMTTGMFLAVEGGNSAPEELDLLAVSAREVFDGLSAAGLRRSFIERNDAQELKEVIVVGDKTVFVFTRVHPAEDAAIVVACDKKTQLGLITMILAKIRAGAEST
jgi:predicted regulator of Ras-like GTPase activity (Roadblock/LC7/MglB family)